MSGWQLAVGVGGTYNAKTTDDNTLLVGGKRYLVSWAISSLETTFSKFPPTILRNLFKVREYTRVVNSGCWNVKQNKSYSWVLLAINRAQDTHGESLVNRSQPGSSVLQHFLRLLFVLMRCCWLSASRFCFAYSFELPLWMSGLMNRGCLCVKFHWKIVERMPGGRFCRGNWTLYQISRGLPFNHDPHSQKT